MADDADLAGDNTDKFEKKAVDFISTESKHRSLIPAGFCHYCGESVAHGLIFCDTRENDCAKDWEHDRLRRKATGR